MNLSRLGRAEVLAVLGGLLLALGLFLPWYETNPDNRNANIDGATGSFSAFDAHPILRWLLLAAATAPFVLAWIILRGHALSWARGEMTVVTSIAAFGLIAYNGVVDRPGDIAISLKLGFAAALVATVVMTGAAAKRSSESERPRKPPGTI